MSKILVILATLVPNFIAAACVSGDCAIGNLNRRTDNAQTYVSDFPSSYSRCIVDPLSSQEFELLNLDNGLPIINNSGVASLPTTPQDDEILFRFVKPSNAMNGFFDLAMSEDYSLSYLAIFESGKVGFTTISSNGLEYISHGQERYVTSVFNVDCNGFITARNINGQQFLFRIINNNLVNELSGEIFPKETPLSSGFLALRSKLTIQTRSGTGLRCPNGGTAITKPGSPSPTANGCGTDNGISSLVPNFDFGSCCNAHDYCFGTCSQSFTTCNDNFYNCNITTCNAKYSSGFGSSILRYGCIKAGEAYAAAVGTQPGKDAFESSTNLHCICV